jgi:hypothetical protein
VGYARGAYLIHMWRRGTETQRHRDTGSAARQCVQEPFYSRRGKDACKKIKSRSPRKVRVGCRNAVQHSNQTDSSRLVERRDGRLANGGGTMASE